MAPHPQDQQDLGNSGPSCVGKAWEHVRFRPPPGDRALLASPASEPGSSQGCKSLSCKTLGCLGLSLPICELVTAVPLGQEGDRVEGGALSLAPREPWAAVNPCAALGSLESHACDEASPTSPAPHPRGPRGVSRRLVPAPSRCCAGPRETETQRLVRVEAERGLHDQRGLPGGGCIWAGQSWKWGTQRSVQGGGHHRMAAAKRRGS